MIARCLIRLSALGVLAYLALPLLVILGASFTATPYLAFPPQGWTLDWYRAMLAEPGYAAAFATSTVLALAATAAAVLLRCRRPGAGAPRIPGQGGAVVGADVTAGPAAHRAGRGAAAVRRVFRPDAQLPVAADRPRGHHRPFVLRATLGLLTPEQRALEEASADLGASPWTTFFLVTLPQIRPGIVTGSIFAFISSWINVELSIFNTTADLNTIPVKLFNYVQYTIDPTIAAVSGATIAAAVIAIVILDLTVGLDMLSERGQ